MTTHIAIPLLTAVSVAQVAPQSRCEGWVTAEFWRTAGPAQVRECVLGGYSIHKRFPPANWTVLHFAARFSGDPEVIAVLITAGANLEDSSPPTLRTPLHVAARFNSAPEIVRVLLRHGADANALNGPGRTPLHLAALYNDDPAVVEELVEATGVNIRAVTGGETPLHDAARRRMDAGDKAGNPNPAIVQTLLKQGADLSVEASDGGTPLGWARTSDVADLIRSEAQRRAETTERFLRAVGTRVALGAVALILLGLPLIRRRNGPATISLRSAYGRS